MSLQAAADKIRAWKKSPLRFVRECFGIEPDPWQAEGLEAFPHQQRMSWKAAKGPGKTALLAWLIWNFIATRPQPKIAATSISGDNLRDGLWTELAFWQGKSPFLTRAFQWSAERIVSKEQPETWWAAARTWSKSANPNEQANTLAGLHADYLLFVIDEAGGVPDAVAAAAEAGLATGKESHLLLAGNPTHHSGPLYRASTRERALWWVREITGDPDDPKRAPRIKIEWAREQIQKYGRDNPFVLVNVFGQYPPQESNALLGVEDVEGALRRELQAGAYVHEPKLLGVDVAYEGNDRSVIFGRQGLVSFPPRIFRNVEPMALAAHVARSIDRFQPDATFIDRTGIGAGVVSRLHQLGYDVIGVAFGERAMSYGGEPTFENQRCAMWWRMAEWVKAGACLPNEPELVAELTAPTYDYANAAGKFSLERKDDLKKRGLASPDLADALALTFAQPVAKRNPLHNAPGARERQRALNDYDPLAALDTASPVAAGDYDPFSEGRP